MTRTRCLACCLLFVALSLAPCWGRAQDAPAPPSNPLFPAPSDNSPSTRGNARAVPAEPADQAVPFSDQHARPNGAQFARPTTHSRAALPGSELDALVALPTRQPAPPNIYFHVDTSLDELLTPKMRAELPADLYREHRAGAAPYYVETEPFNEDAVRELAARVAAAQKARRMAELERKAEDERKRKEAEAKRIAEQKRKEEEARRKAEAERKRKEEVARRIAEQKRKEEAARQAAEKARTEPDPAPEPKPEAVAEPEPKPTPAPKTAEKSQVALAPEPKPATKKPSASYARPGGRLETDPTVLADPKAAKALEQFKHFALEWLAKNNRTYVKGTRDNIKVTEQGGTYVAQYMASEPSSLETLVKPSEYDHTPFIGVMRYEEKLYRAEGATPEAAKGGTFEEVDATRVTEIFRYAKNKWQY